MMKGKGDKSKSSSLPLQTSQSGERLSSSDRQEDKRHRIKKKITYVYTEHQ